MVKILAFDSAARVAAVAVTEEEQVLSLFLSDHGLTQSELLLPMAEQALRVSRTSLDDIGLFAVTVGPGSFTGVRIGVATVKGLCFGTGKPCAPVSSLEALAEGLRPLPGMLCPVMDARRGNVYTALFRTDGDTLLRLTDDDLLPVDSLIRTLSERKMPVCFAGDAALLVAERAARLAPELPITPLPRALLRPSAAAVAACALRLFRAGRCVTDEALQPVYLRPTQAERERLARTSPDSGPDTAGRKPCPPTA